MAKLQDLRGRYTELHEAEQFGVIVSTFMLHAHTHTHALTHTHTHTFAHTHARMHAHTHTHTYNAPLQVYIGNR